MFVYKQASFFFEEKQLRGISKFFLKEAEEEYKHAKEIETYVIFRGDSPTFNPINIPKLTWHRSSEVFNSAYDLEVTYTNLIKDYIKESQQLEDAHLEDFWIKLLDSQYHSIREFEKYKLEVQTYDKIPGLIWHLDHNIE